MLLYRDVHRSYYDALGLTPKASQTDIKNAYYKMSMVFHPDKGAVRFIAVIITVLCFYYLTVIFYDSLS